MFGPAMLVSPITEPGVTEWKTYLPKYEGGWEEVQTAKHFEVGPSITTKVHKEFIPVFIKVSHKK